MKVQLCPECGSGKINKLDVLSGVCRCDACEWAGKEADLVSSNIAGSSLDVAIAVAQTLLLTITQHASIPIGQAMIEAGVLPASSSATTAARLVKAAMLGAHKAILDEVSKIQQEMTDANKS